MKETKLCSWCGTIYKKKKKKCGACGYKYENLCERCPSEIRGLCCFFSTIIKDYDTNKIKYNIILENHPCKYLDCYKIDYKEQNRNVTRGCRTIKEAELFCKEHKININKIKGTGTLKCTIYKNRFNKNKNCANLKKGLINGTFPEKCLYVQKLRKNSDIDIPYKIFYKDIESSLNNREKGDYHLMMLSHHEGPYGIIKY